MSDYRDSLNLPQTAFPMKASLTQREPRRLAQWQDNNLYGQIREACAGKPRYILHDGPPYANGELHVGHAVNKILKDIVVRSRTLMGFDAPYIPGWDCHGLPIELNVEKKVGKPGVKISAGEFRDRCRAYAASQIDRQREDFKRMGVLGDWDNPYLTMDYHFEANIVRTLGEIIANGHLHKGAKPVHWCLDCGSALAEAEVEYRDRTSPAIDVAYRAVDTVAVLSAFGAARAAQSVVIPIWTTTPWTLPASMAVSLHPTLEYSLLVRAGQGLVLATDLLDSPVRERIGWGDVEVCGTAAGAALENQLLQHPFYSRQVPVIVGEHVTTEVGTGAVHTAPGHGQDDFLVGRKYGLEVLNPVGGNGVYLADTEIFAGQHIHKANDAIIELLAQRGLLLHREAYLHSCPHCWRHQTPIIFRATPQWFISMQQNGLLKGALEAVAGLQFEPDWGRTRMQSMLVERPDWCISRQRTWGVPITLFVHRETAELHPDTTALIEQVAVRVEQQGIEAWFELDAAELLGAGADQYDKVTDTLDVWFDSGVTHACVLRRRAGLQFPADLYLEGSDQHRGWFQSSLLTAIGATGQAPYKALLTHGFTVDGEGRKMSKSLGNVISARQALNELGADVLRLWVAATDYRGEMAYSDEIIKRTSDSYRRIRNTARFLLANLNGFDPAKNLVAPAQLLALDAWAIDRAADVQKEVIDAYDKFQFHLIYQRLHNFCVGEMGGFYLDIIKDRLYTTRADSPARRSAQTALYHIAEALVRWIAPILSFTAEEIWENLPGERAASVCLVEWYQDLERVAEDAESGPGPVDGERVIAESEDRLDPAGAEPESVDWERVIAVRDAVNRALENQRDAVNRVLESWRDADRLKGGLDAKAMLFCDEPLRQTLEVLEDELRFVLITSEVELLRPIGEKQSDKIEELTVLAKLSGELYTDTGVEGLSAVLVEASKHKKCGRCWHRRADVGSHPTHPELCGRCIENIEGSGEERRFA